MDRDPSTDSLSRLGPLLLRYAAGLAAVGVAVLIRHMLAPQLGTELPFITLFPAIFIVAFFFGLGLAVVATVAGLWVALQFFIEPVGKLTLSGAVPRLGALTFTNPAAAALLGGSPEAHVGRVLWEVFPEVPAGPFGPMLRRAMGGDRVYTVQAHFPPLGRWLQVSAYPSADGLSVVIRDVTDRIRAQDANERLAAIVVSSEDAIVGKQLHGTITSWNEAAERIFGYRADEIVGRSIFTLVPPELHDSERDVLDRVRRGEPVAFSETERVRKDGERITSRSRPKRSASRWRECSSAVARRPRRGGSHQGCVCVGAG